jgi:hypothetical protein
MDGVETSNSFVGCNRGGALYNLRININLADSTKVATNELDCIGATSKDSSGHFNFRQSTSYEFVRTLAESSFQGSRFRFDLH